MYTLIDCTNYTAIATSTSWRALAALAYIQFANVDTVIMPCDQNRPFAHFDSKQLDKIFQGVIAKIETPTSFSYTDSIHRCRAAIEAAQHLRFPFDESFMEAQADKIKPGDDRPYVISTDKASPSPVKAKAWTMAPNVNRPRFDRATSPQLTPKAYHYSEAPRSRAIEAEAPKAPKAPPAPGKAPAAPKPPKVPAKPRAPMEGRATANGITRPGAGSKTATIWDVADELAKKLKRAPTGKEVKEEARTRGCADGTINVQYRNWAIFHGVEK